MDSSREVMYDSVSESYRESYQETIRNSSSYEFKHFSTSQDCTTYLLNNPNINISYKCCSGKGYAFPKKDVPTKILTKGREKEKNEKKKKIEPTIKGVCEICFTEDMPLYTMCNCCKQPFCKDCLKKLSSKRCPYCRGELRTHEFSNM